MVTNIARPDRSPAQAHLCRGPGAPGWRRGTLFVKNAARIPLTVRVSLVGPPAVTAPDT
ncbi:hypothetical protein MN0502_20990 [Arthrobacter sp. MN05-02]|nr:hypothetical protein MN0502_20990 [Arthrobacter sp. MN05-02]